MSIRGYPHVCGIIRSKNLVAGELHALCNYHRCREPTCSAPATGACGDGSAVAILWQTQVQPRRLPRIEGHDVGLQPPEIRRSTGPTALAWTTGIASPARPRCLFGASVQAWGSAFLMWLRVKIWIVKF